MEIVLLDSSPLATERLQALTVYGHAEHYESLLEMAGMHPDWTVVDVNQGPEVTRELQEEWGLHVCGVAQHVTLQLRRRFPKLKNLVSDAQLIDFLEELGEGTVREEHRNNSQSILKEPSTFKSDNSQTNFSENKLNSGVGTPVRSIELKPVLHSVRESMETVENVKHRHQRAKIYAVGPLRNTGGGAGKTAFVSNFAAYSAKKGLSVLVIDLDPNGVFGTLVDAQGEMNVTYWERLMQQNPDAEMTERAVQDSVELHPVFGFYMISSASKVSVISPAVLSWILAQTRRYFDIIMVDTPAMWADSIVLMMQEADQVVLIGLHDAAQYPHYKATLELMTNPIMPVGVTRERIRVVISRAYLGKNREGEMEEISRQLDVPLSLIIPEDSRFYSYRENHKAIVLDKPTAEYSKAVIPWFNEQIAEWKGHQNLPAVLTNVQRDTKIREGLFTRLFGGGKKASKAMKRA